MYDILRSNSRRKSIEIYVNEHTLCRSCAGAAQVCAGVYVPAYLCRSCAGAAQVCAEVVQKLCKTSNVVAGGEKCRLNP